MKANSKRVNTIITAVFLLCCLMMLGGVVLGKKDGDDITIGKHRVLSSKILNEEREILVYLPSGYSESSDRYPVLYTISGDEIHFSAAASVISRQSSLGRGPGMILIDIVDSHHTRDLFPVALQGRSDTGFAANFRQFIIEELIPFVEKSYRTENFRILMGESNAGLFTTDFFLSSPGTFNAYIVSSPMLGWCYDYMEKKTREFFNNNKTLNNYLFIIYASDDYNRATDTIPQYREILKANAPTGLKWASKVIENGGHVPYTSLYDGLNFIFQGWVFPRDLYDKEGIGAIENFYRKLSEKYGFPVKVPEEVIADIGIPLLREKNDWQSAVEIFRLNVKHHPQSCRGHYILGAAYAQGNQKEEAVKHLKKALEIDPDFAPAANRLKQLEENNK